VLRTSRETTATTPFTTSGTFGESLTHAGPAGAEARASLDRDPRVQRGRALTEIGSLATMLAEAIPEEERAAIEGLRTPAVESAYPAGAVEGRLAGAVPKWELRALVGCHR
jgi:hypothetical protein